MILKRKHNIWINAEFDQEPYIVFLHKWKVILRSVYQAIKLPTKYKDNVHNKNVIRVKIGHPVWATKTGSLKLKCKNDHFQSSALSQHDIFLYFSLESVSQNSTERKVIGQELNTTLLLKMNSKYLGFNLHPQEINELKIL